MNLKAAMGRRARPLAVVVALACLATTALAESDKARFEAWRAAGAAGSPEDQVRVALAYLDGRVTKRDAQQGEAWLKVARDQKHAEADFIAAQRMLAAKGSGAKALVPLAAASEQGFVPAQTSLAAARLYGRGATQDVGRGLVHLNGAARAGDPEAQYMLARAYLFGRGLGRNPAIGTLWLEAAARRGHTSAQLALARHLSRRDRSEAGRIASLKWALLATWGGHPQAIALVEAVSADLSKHMRDQGRAEASAFKAISGPMDPEIARL